MLRTLIILRRTSSVRSTSLRGSIQILVGVGAPVSEHDSLPPLSTLFSTLLTSISFQVQLFWDVIPSLEASLNLSDGSQTSLTRPLIAPALGLQTDPPQVFSSS